MKIEAESKFEIGDVVKHVGFSLVQPRAVGIIVQIDTATCTAGTQILYGCRFCGPGGMTETSSYNECELAPLTDEDRLALGGALWKKTRDTLKGRTGDTDAPTQ